MNAHSRRRRVLALVWAIVQIALPPLLGVADADAAALANAGVPGHVEDRSGPACPRVHAPDCALCQILATHASPAPSSAPAWPWVTTTDAPAAGYCAIPRATGLRLPDSRAPPLVS